MAQSRVVVVGAVSHMATWASLLPVSPVSQNGAVRLTPGTSLNSCVTVSIRKFLPVHPRIPLACPLGRFGVDYSRYRNDRLRLWDLEGVAEDYKVASDYLKGTTSSSGTVRSYVVSRTPLTSSLKPPLQGSFMWVKHFIWGKRLMYRLVFPRYGV